MPDHCIHERELGELQTSVDHLSREIDGNGSPGLSKTVPVLIKSVDDLNASVGDLRAVISGFSQYVAGQKAVDEVKTKGFGKTIQVIALVLTLVGTVIAFAAMSNKTTERVRDIVDGYEHNKFITRGDTIV